MAGGRILPPGRPWIAATVLLASVMATACTAVPASSTSSLATATPDASAVASQLESIETARVAALLSAKGDAAGAYLAADYQLVTPSGTTYSKGDYLGAIASGALHYLAWKAVTPMVVRVHGDGAILRYQALITVQDDKGPVTGVFWHTDYYERIGGAWLVVWSQATEIQ